MKEYRIESDGKTPVDLTKLVTGFIPEEGYRLIHANTVLPCHDVYINLKNDMGVDGLLLVRRKQDPAKGLLWPIGGRILRGVPTEESLRKKSREECGLELENIAYLGVSRICWQKEAFGHGRGYDSFGFNYFARGIGELKLNDLHNSPEIITLEDYTNEFRIGLHPYVVEFMDKAMDQLR